MSQESCDKIPDQDLRLSLTFGKSPSSLLLKVLGKEGDIIIDHELGGIEGVGKSSEDEVATILETGLREEVSIATKAKLLEEFRLAHYYLFNHQ